MGGTTDGIAGLRGGIGVTGGIAGLIAEGAARIVGAGFGVGVEDVAAGGTGARGATGFGGGGCCICS